MWHCEKVLRYIPPPASWAKIGKYVKYSAEEVLKRRAARYALVTVCTFSAAGAGIGGVLLPPGPASVHPAPIPFQGPPVGFVGLPPPPVWIDGALPPPPTWINNGKPVHDVMEPGTAILLGAALILLAVFRFIRRR